MTPAGEVKRAAADVVAAFSRHDPEAYFAKFSPNATFIFHGTPEFLCSRREYEELWDSWEKEGFRVLGCTSRDGAVQMLSDDVGVFFHVVRTTLADGDKSIETGERETIVFQRIDGHWLGVHEHLSIDPAFRVTGRKHSAATELLTERN